MSRSIDVETITNIVKAALETSSEITIDTKMSDIVEWDSLGHLLVLSALDNQLGDEYQESLDVAKATSIKELLQAMIICQPTQSR